MGASRITSELQAREPSRPDPSHNREDSELSTLVFRGLTEPAVCSFWDSSFVLGVQTPVEAATSDCII